MQWWQACSVHVLTSPESQINISQEGRRLSLMSSITRSQQVICKSHFGFEGSQALTKEEFFLESKILWNRPMIISILMALYV